MMVRETMVSEKNTVNFNIKIQDVENRLIFEARSGTL